MNIFTVQSNCLHAKMLNKKMVYEPFLKLPFQDLLNRQTKILMLQLLMNKLKTQHRIEYIWNSII